jgi:hypothetical protein
MAAPPLNTKLRAATLADAEAIGALFERNELARMDVGFFRELWAAYPFAAEFSGVPIGWALEAEGKIVGALLNAHMLYELAGQKLRAITTAGWAVDMEYRRQSLQLLTAFFRTKGVDLWLDGSANPTASKVLTGMRIPRIPVTDYDSPCFWPVRRRAFAKAALSRKSIRGAAALAWPAGVALRLRDLVRRSGAGRPRLTMRRLQGFDERFDPLWRQIAAGPPRVRAVRTKAVLEWRFRGEMRSGNALVLAAEDAGELRGYTVLVRRATSGMDLLEVMDLEAAADDTGTTRDLLLAAIAMARETDADAVKFLAGTPVKRSCAQALQPYTYRFPHWQLFYKAASPELNSRLSFSESWDFSPFDTY